MRISSIRRKSASQRESILDVAGRLFWDKGYDATTMRDIARACGFEPGNIYNYFLGKEQILYEVIKQELSLTLFALKRIETDESGTPGDRLQSLFKICFDLTTGPHRPNRLIFDTELRSLSVAHGKEVIALRDNVDRILRQIIRSGMDAGEFANVNEKIVGFAIISMIIRARIWFSTRGPLSSEEIADIMFEFALNGLRKR